MKNVCAILVCAFALFLGSAVCGEIAAEADETKSEVFHFISPDEYYAVRTTITDDFTTWTLSYKRPRANGEILLETRETRRIKIMWEGAELNPLPLHDGIIAAASPFLDRGTMNFYVVTTRFCGNGNSYMLTKYQLDWNDGGKAKESKRWTIAQDTCTGGMNLRCYLTVIGNKVNVYGIFTIPIEPRYEFIGMFDADDNYHDIYRTKQYVPVHSFRQ